MSNTLSLSLVLCLNLNVYTLAPNLYWQEYSLQLTCSQHVWFLTEYIRGIFFIAEYSYSEGNLTSIRTIRIFVPSLVRTDRFLPLMLEFVILPSRLRTSIDLLQARRRKRAESFFFIFSLLLKLYRTSYTNHLEWFHVNWSKFQKIPRGTISNFLYIYSVYIYAIHDYVQTCRSEIIIAAQLQAIKGRGGSGHKVNFAFCIIFE